MQERVACLSLRNLHLSGIHHLSVYGPRKSRIRHSASSIYYAKNPSLVQPLSHIQLFATPWTAAHQASLSITNSRSLPKLMSTELVMPFNLLILFCPLLLLPVIVPASGSFPMSQLFESGGQSIGASASVLPAIIQG